MMRKIVLTMVLFFCPSLAFTQGTRYDNVAFKNVAGQPPFISGATIYVCLSTATGVPCSPTTPVFADQALTQQLTFPLNSDVNGNFGFWAPAGQFYKITIQAPGLNPFVLIWSAPLVGGGAVSFSSITSTSLSPASSGFIRMASGDQVCWNNASGSANLCLNKDLNDNLFFGTRQFAYLNAVQTFSLVQTFSVPSVFSQPTGAPPFSVSSTTNVPNLNASFLSGATFSSPGPIGNTVPSTGAFTTLSATAQITSTVSTGTAPFSVASTTLVPNLNVQNLNSVLVTGTPLVNQVLQATSGTAATWNTLPVFTTVKVFSSATLGSIVSLTASTDTSLSGLALTVTMPSVGCPCRVLATYTVFHHNTNGNNAAYTLETEVSDGTNLFAFGRTRGANTNNIYTIANMVSAVSPVTYSNGAVVTFTPHAETDLATIQIDTAGTFYGSTNFAISVVLSS